MNVTEAVALPLDPQQRYLHLGADGAAQALPGGAEFWSLPQAELDRLGAGWVLSEYEFVADWPSWEMHPNGDEFVYLLSGAIDLVLEQPQGVQVVAIAGRGAVVVPRGVWHTARVHAPSRVLHVTLGAGTRTRAVVPA
jgi:mannose-6-phosphate isomerase-like protein (cupin superfamily)